MSEHTSSEFRPPYRVEVTDRAADLREAHAQLADGANSGVTVTVAGRVMLLRDMGRLSFATLRDSSGAIQLMATAKGTDDYKGLTALDLGDWIVATGEVVRSNKGELSVRVERWQLLAEARRGFGDKWKGITDTDLRYRQRYADLWANDDSMRVFQARSRIMAETRRFLEGRGFVEVETPTLHAIAGGARPGPSTRTTTPSTSTSTCASRSSCTSSGCWSAGSRGCSRSAACSATRGVARHNPEFTMLELYQAYGDYRDMMDLTEELVAHLAQQVTRLDGHHATAGGSSISPRRGPARR